MTCPNHRHFLLSPVSFYRVLFSLPISSCVPLCTFKYLSSTRVLTLSLYVPLYRFLRLPLHASTGPSSICSFYPALDIGILYLYTWSYVYVYLYVLIPVQSANPLYLCSSSTSLLSITHLSTNGVCFLLEDLLDSCCVLVIYVVYNPTCIGTYRLSLYDPTIWTTVI